MKKHNRLYPLMLSAMLSTGACAETAFFTADSIKAQSDTLFDKTETIKAQKCEGINQPAHHWILSTTIAKTNIDWLDNLVTGYAVTGKNKPMTRNEAIAELQGQFNSNDKNGCTDRDIGRKVNVSLQNQYAQFVTFKFDTWTWLADFTNVPDTGSEEVTFDLVKKQIVTVRDIFPTANDKKLEALIKKNMSDEVNVQAGSSYHLEADDNIVVNKNGVGFPILVQAGYKYVDLPWKEIKHFILPDVKKSIP